MDYVCLRLHYHVKVSSFNGVDFFSHSVVSWEKKTNNINKKKTTLIRQEDQDKK